MALQLRPRCRVLTNPTLLHFYSFSSSSNPFDPSLPLPEDPTNASSQQSPVSSLFGDVKASLKHQPRRPADAPSPFSRPSSPPPPKAASLEEISRNLSQFRIRTAAPQPRPPAPSDSSSSSSEPISFQELYKKNIANRNGGSNLNPGSGSLSPFGQPFDGIRESLNKIRTDGGMTQQTERRGEEAEYLRDSLRLRPAQTNADSRFVGRAEGLPLSVFGKEMGPRKDWGNINEAMRTEYVKIYGYEDLGKKLRALRSETTAKGGFSVSELNERLVKLREMEEQEAQSTQGLPYKDLRESLQNIKMSSKNKSTTPVKLNAFGGLGLTPEYMLQPPQEHLVEKYFHPDNMSAAEKLNLELQKVREEFKMSESDCGSARVQVAQLTTKIKHLSSVLHKKDKHSRKGLVAMVQRRKKLLKYLRRTDWDSYCFVLSKLGLRDNPDYKN